jgi:hypothetical protein
MTECSGDEAEQEAIVVDFVLCCHSVYLVLLSVLLFRMTALDQATKGK